MKASSAIALVLLILVAALFWQIRKRPRPTPEIKFTSTQELMDYLASEAVKDARQENRISLDYSVDSIKSVEQILGTLHELYVKNPSSISVKALASSYGAYIGEVIRRSDPGAEWARDDEVGGEKSYPIIWGAGHSYPMAWCYRRIVDGPEDNVWIKYSALKKQKAESSLLGTKK